MKLGYRGDFAEFACVKCKGITCVIIKSGELESYHCAYCGFRMPNESKEEHEAIVRKIREQRY